MYLDELGRENPLRKRICETVLDPRGPMTAKVLDDLEKYKTSSTWAARAVSSANSWHQSLALPSHTGTF